MGWGLRNSSLPRGWPWYIRVKVRSVCIHHDFDLSEKLNVLFFVRWDDKACFCFVLLLRSCAGGKHQQLKLHCKQPKTLLWTILLEKKKYSCEHSNNDERCEEAVCGSQVLTQPNRHEYILAEQVSAKPRLSKKLEMSLCCNFLIVSVSILSECCAYALFMFRHQNQLAWFGKVSRFGLKYLLWSPPPWIEMLRLPEKNNRFGSPQ